MKALVESTNFAIDRDIAPILRAITNSSTLADLKSEMKDVETRLSRYVEYGFGSSHMWVSCSETNERLIIVTE